MEWISVENDTPETGLVCLVYDDQMEKIGIREFGTHYFHSIDSDGDDGILGINITHWMPLPETPTN